MPPPVACERIITRVLLFILSTGETGETDETIEMAQNTSNLVPRHRTTKQRSTYRGLKRGSSPGQIRGRRRLPEASAERSQCGRNLISANIPSDEGMPANDDVSHTDGVDDGIVGQEGGGMLSKAALLLHSQSAPALNTTLTAGFLDV